MGRGPDGFVVVGGTHLALEVGVVRQGHVGDAEAELARVVIAEHAVPRNAGDGPVIT